MSDQISLPEALKDFAAYREDPVAYVRNRLSNATAEAGEALGRALAEQAAFNAAHPL